MFPGSTPVPARTTLGARSARRASTARPALPPTTTPPLYHHDYLTHSLPRINPEPPKSPAAATTHLTFSIPFFLSRCAHCDFSQDLLLDPEEYLLQMKQRQPENPFIDQQPLPRQTLVDMKGASISPCMCNVDWRLTEASHSNTQTSWFSTTSSTKPLDGKANPANEVREQFAARKLPAESFVVVCGFECGRKFVAK